MDPKPKRRRKKDNKNFTEAQRQAIIRRSEGKCEVRTDHLCTIWGNQISHVLAKSRGGTNDLENAHWACPAGHRAEEKLAKRNWRTGKAYGHRA